MPETIHTYYEPTVTGKRWYLAHWEKALGLELRLNHPERIGTGTIKDSYKITHHNRLKTTFLNQRISLEEAHIIQSFGVWVDENKKVHLEHFVPLDALFDPEDEAYLDESEVISRLQQWVDESIIELVDQNPVLFDAHHQPIARTLANMPVHVIADNYYAGETVDDKTARCALLARIAHQDGDQFPAGVYATALEYFYDPKGYGSIDSWFQLTTPNPNLVDWSIFEADMIDRILPVFGQNPHHFNGEDLYWIGRRVKVSLVPLNNTWVINARYHTTPDDVEAPAVSVTYLPLEGPQARAALVAAIQTAATLSTMTIGLYAP